MNSPTIPIQNIYYLLCYAWNKLDEGDVVDVSSLQNTELANLFAKVLLNGTRHLIRRGFDRGYLEYAEERATLRGKIAFAPSLRRNLFQHGRAHCEFDELDHNVLHNRILKTTIRKLINLKELDRELKDGLSDMLRWLRQVDEVVISAPLFRRVQLHRNNHFYGFLMNVCEVIHENLLVDERTGNSRFRDFLRDKKAMSRLFEAFVKNFYKIEQKEFAVSAREIKWLATFPDEEARRYLPKMRTDVFLHQPGRMIVLDCKFYREALQYHHDKPKFKSSHLYQLHAYLSNLEIEPDGKNCEGILLYPAVNYSLDLSFELRGHSVRIKTINLAQDWQLIRRDLLSLIECSQETSNLKTISSLSLAGEFTARETG